MDIWRWSARLTLPAAHARTHARTHRRARAQPTLLRCLRRPVCFRGRLRARDDVRRMAAHGRAASSAQATPRAPPPPSRRRGDLPARPAQRRHAPRSGNNKRGGRRQRSSFPPLPGALQVAPPAAASNWLAVAYLLVTGIRPPRPPPRESRVLTVLHLVPGSTEADLAARPQPALPPFVEFLDNAYCVITPPPLPLYEQKYKWSLTNYVLYKDDPLEILPPPPFTPACRNFRRTFLLPLELLLPPPLPKVVCWADDAEFEERLRAGLPLLRRLRRLFRST